jgi:hypothetical protein
MRRISARDRHGAVAGRCFSPHRSRPKLIVVGMAGQALVITIPTGRAITILYASLHTPAPPARGDGWPSRLLLRSSTGVDRWASTSVPPDRRVRETLTGVMRRPLRKRRTHRRPSYNDHT